MNHDSENVLVPITIKIINSKIHIVSFLVPRVSYKEPFFIDSLVKYFGVLESQIKLPEEDEPLTRPFDYNEHDPRVIFTPIEDFINKNKKDISKKKLGFIFHMSRCGSTLATQMLASNDKFFVLSEPTIINAVLDPNLHLGVSDRKRLLSSCINALVSISPHVSKNVFIKFRSWNTFYMNLITGEFPTVNWIFIHRHGLEVLSSVIEKPPGWIRSRIGYAKHFADILSVSADTIKNIEVDEFVARVLGAFCRIAAGFNSKRARFIDYLNMPNNFINSLVEHWDVQINDIEKQEMIKASRLYSKDVKRSKLFMSDSGTKRLRATQAQAYLIDKFVEIERSKLY